LPGKAPDRLSAAADRLASDTEVLGARNRLKIVSTRQLTLAARLYLAFATEMAGARFDQDPASVPPRRISPMVLLLLGFEFGDSKVESPTN
jgi:hypothetical protein